MYFPCLRTSKSLSWGESRELQSTIICICFSHNLEVFLIVFKCILSIFHGFVVGVIGEAKKRKISTRGEDLLQ